jgi:hypothetical protein
MANYKMDKNVFGQRLTPAHRLFVSHFESLPSSTATTIVVGYLDSPP